MVVAGRGCPGEWRAVPHDAGLVKGLPGLPCIVRPAPTRPPPPSRSRSASPRRRPRRWRCRCRWPPPAPRPACPCGHGRDARPAGSDRRSATGSPPSERRGGRKARVPEGHAVPTGRRLTAADKRAYSANNPPARQAGQGAHMPRTVSARVPRTTDRAPLRDRIACEPIPAARAMRMTIPPPMAGGAGSAGPGVSGEAHIARPGRGEAAGRLHALPRAAHGREARNRSFQGALRRNADPFPESARRHVLSRPTIDAKRNALFDHAAEHGIPLYVLIDE